VYHWLAVSVDRANRGPVGDGSSHFILRECGWFNEFEGSVTGMGRRRLKCCQCREVIVVLVG